MHVFLSVLNLDPSFVQLSMHLFLSKFANLAESSRKQMRQ